MNALEIIADWLAPRGYEGLCNWTEECGCSLEEICPCGAPGEDCEPARRVVLEPDGYWVPEERR